ncbi:MAG: hypothetical protein C0497_07595 [Gemmatimonas sp.]|nr:hypothetical protein [Gemmatimonas sp.]
MYKRILVPLENTRTDRVILDHVRQVARHCGAAIVLCEEIIADGLPCEAVLACGNPADEIAAAAMREGADLIAMATHGHRGLNDLIRGSVASELRHRTHVPVLMVREAPPRSAP